MGYYAVPGNQSTVTSAFKTAAQVNASGATKRGKVFEIILGANSNPNATDTYLEWQLSRITATGAGAYTTWTPTLLDPADGAAVSVSGVNATAAHIHMAAMGKPVWVRFTLVPGLTDDPANVEAVARFVAPMKNVEWVEVQPFHQLGAFKWKAMDLQDKHANTPPPPADLVNRVIEQFRSAGCRAR